MFTHIQFKRQSKAKLQLHFETETSMGTRADLTSIFPLREGIQACQAVIHQMQLQEFRLYFHRSQRCLNDNEVIRLETESNACARVLSSLFVHCGYRIIIKATHEGEAARKA